MISATSSQIGTVIHVNDEVEGILGYKKKDLLNKNISMIIPRPIAKVHDRLIQRYFQTAKPTVIDIKRELFGVSNEGYLKPVRLLVKVYPQLTDKLIFVGFLQTLDVFQDMQEPK